MEIKQIGCHLLVGSPGRQCLFTLLSPNMNGVCAIKQYFGNKVKLNIFKITRTSRIESLSFLMAAPRRVSAPVSTDCWQPTAERFLRQLLDLW